MLVPRKRMTFQNEMGGDKRKRRVFDESGLEEKVDP
jgi:hypothetical protein